MVSSRLWRPLALSLSVTLAACSEEVVTAAPVPVARPAAVTPVSFVDRVWKVGESAQLAPGTLYVFLSDGNLVIAAPQGTPAFGKWREENGELIMVEEGIPVRIEVLKLSRDIFRIRSLNPGEPLEVTLVPAAF